MEIWPKGARRRAVSRLCAVIVRNRCGIGGKLSDRTDGAAVTAAARNRLTGVERQLEISVRTCLKSADAREIDQPRPVHPHDIERYQSRFLGGEGCSDEVIGAVCEAVFNVISGRTDPKNVAGVEPSRSQTVWGAAGGRSAGPVLTTDRDCCPSRRLSISHSAPPIKKQVTTSFRNS